jgi:hypothetical protein
MIIELRDDARRLQRQLGIPEPVGKTRTRASVVLCMAALSSCPRRVSQSHPLTARRAPVEVTRTSRQVHLPASGAWIAPRRVT